MGHSRWGHLMGNWPRWSLDEQLPYRLPILLTPSIEDMEKMYLIISNIVMLWNTITKATWRGKGSFGSNFHITICHWRKSGQEECGSHGGVLLIGLLLMSCSPYFPIEPRTTWQGMMPPTLAWDLFHQSVIKKMFYRLTYSLILQRHFLNWGSLFLDDYGLYQVHIELSSTM